jgi:predicted RNA polymerase sigma factor
MPTEPEVAGLLALIRLHRARAAARFGPDGGLVVLQHQQRALWDRAAIADATRLLARAADRLAPELTANPAEQAVLHQCITWT